MFSDKSAPSSDLYRQLVDGVPDAVVAVDSKGVIVLVNRQVESTFGYLRAELVGQPVEVLLPERFRERHHGHRASFAAAPTVRSMGSGLLLTARRKDGSEVPVEISLGPIETPEGRLTAATIRDVTERRRIEEETRRISWYLRCAVESIGDAFALVDEHDRLVIVNSAARGLFERPLSGGIMGRAFTEVIHASVQAGTFDLRGEPAGVLEARWLAYHRKPEGSLELRTASGRVLRLSGRRTAEGGAVMLIADVSDDMALADELRRAWSTAEAANAAKSEFLASMSHELRTPLNAVLGFAQLLQRDKKTPLTDRQQERIAHVLRGGEHLLKLIDEVLDLSRIEAGRVTISKEPVALPLVLEEVRASLEPMAARQGVTLGTDALPPGLPSVLADRTRLSQVLMNFGSNAIKYGKDGGHAVFHVEQRGARLRVSVRDDGIGVPASHREKLFEPFQRAGQETGPIEGTGIGLAISKRLAELMGGAVGFESQPGSGSEFWVEVPVHDTPTMSAVVPSTSASTSPLGSEDDGPRHLVVYVEDNPSNIAFMRALLEELPRLELITAPSAEIGIELVRARQPAVVIMDLNLPGMSGIEATRRLAAWPETRAIPVIALTAAAMTRDTERAVGAGFYRYLTKPVKLDELTSVLEAIVAPATEAGQAASAS
ncbi:MAG: PAS domain S-box protein [Myxococcota bacterium]